MALLKQHIDVGPRHANVMFEIDQAVVDDDADEQNNGEKMHNNSHTQTVSG